MLRGLFTKTMETGNKPALKEVRLRLSGSSGREATVSDKEFDGLKAVGNVLLNLDAALTR